MIAEKKLKEKIHSVIPGGAHTYSRGDDQFPENAPAVLIKGKGAYVWGSDGKKYLDYGMGLRSVTIGYAQEEIDAAAIREIKKGNNLTKASMTELQAADKLLSLYPGMEMVKFATNGSTVTTAAVKLARAFTGRKLIVRCADHPFFSYDDWFIGDTVMSRGVPQEIAGLTKQFRFNDIDSLKKFFKSYKNEIACVITEPTTHIEPEEGFLPEVQELTHENGAVLISDEISCCFRVDYASYLRYGFSPDMVTIGKGIANGYPVDALLGTREIMDLGGINKKGQERVFLISTTFGATMSGLGAMMATIDFYRKHDVLSHLWRYNEQLMTKGNAIAEELGVRNRFYFEGFPGRLNVVTKDATGNHSTEFRTLFLQEMIHQRVLIPWIANSYAHKNADLRKTLDALTDTLEVYKKALREGVQKYLKGKPVQPVFRKYN